HSYLPALRALLFCRHRAHRALPSFPTRRSSDLAGRAHHNNRLAFLQMRHEAAGDAELERDERQQASLLVYPRACQRDPLHEQRKDRKSTRLNSSHLVISYAVFCLKKKKKTTTCT